MHAALHAVRCLSEAVLDPQVFLLKRTLADAFDLIETSRMLPDVSYLHPEAVQVLGCCAKQCTANGVHVQRQKTLQIAMKPEEVDESFKLPMHFESKTVSETLIPTP